jgi:hypothetical protein
MPYWKRPVWWRSWAHHRTRIDVLDAVLWRKARLVPSIRRAAPLDKKGEGERGRLSILRHKEISGAARRMKRTGLPRRCAPRNDEFSKGFPSPAWRGRVPAGRERAFSNRRAAPLTEKEEGETERLSTFHRQEISGAARRMVGPLSLALSPLRGARGILWVGGILWARGIHCKNLSLRKSPTSSLRGPQARGNPERSIRRAAPLI